MLESLKPCISSSLQYLLPHLPALPPDDLVGAHLLLLEALDHVVLETGGGRECNPTVKRADLGGAVVCGCVVFTILQVGAELGTTVSAGGEGVTLATAGLVNTKCFNTSPHLLLAERAGEQLGHLLLCSLGLLLGGLACQA